MKNLLLRQKQICKELDISQSTLWRWRRDGVFPEPINIPGTSIHGWPKSVVEEWIHSKINKNVGDE